MNENNYSRPNAQMSFLDHLDALRWHLVRCIIAILVFAIAAFVFKEFVFDTIILAPKDKYFITNRALCKLADLINAPNLCIGDISLKIINIKLSGQFMTHIYISLFMGLIAAAPYCIWELWRFISPALNPNEKSASGGGVIYSSLLFMLGVLFAYFVVVPLTINFFGTYEVSSSVDNTIALNSYVSTVLSVTLGIGVVFEMPILVFFLSKAGMITPASMKRRRRIMIVAIFVIAGIITPADILSMFLVAVPLLALYEISIGISRRIYKKKLKAETKI